MELRHLRYFEVAAETLNFTRAAERLHITQSTLSHQIRQLEEELGVVLFDRVGRSVRLSESGEMLRRHMTPALLQIDRGLQALRGETQSPASCVRLGTTPTFNARMVPMCVSDFLTRHPGHEIIVEELTAGPMEEALREGRLDLAVSYQPPEGSELWFEPLYREEMKLVVQAAHPLARRRRVRMIELHQLRMVLLPGSTATRRMLDGFFEAAGAIPQVVAQFNSIAIMIELVRKTDLAAIIGETAVQSSEDLRVIPIEDPTPVRTPGLLWKRGFPHPQAVRVLAAIIRAAVREAG